MPPHRELDPGASALDFFGAELRRLRSKAGMSQEALGAMIGYSYTLVGAVERASRIPTPEFAELADGALDSDGLLSRLLREWVHKESYPKWFRPLVELEREATSIRTFEALIVDGLLQTEDYARALLRGGRPGDSSDQIEELVTARVERQRLLHGDGPHLWIVLDEMALRRTVGNTKIMHDQLDALATAAEQHRLMIQVVPLTAGGHAGMVGAFKVLTLTDGADVVYIEGPASSQVLNRPSEVAECNFTYDILRAAALPLDSSVDLIRRVQGEYS